MKVSPQYHTAHLSGPSGTNTFKVTRRDEDDLPDHVKGDVRWRIDQPPGPGYYIRNRKNRKYLPLEFIDDYWYQLHVFTGEAFTSEDAKVPRNTKGIGYWDINNYEHPNNRRQRDSTRYIPTQAVEAIRFKYTEHIYELEEEAEDRYT